MATSVAAQLEAADALRRRNIGRIWPAGPICTTKSLRGEDEPEFKNFRTDITAYAGWVAEFENAFQIPKNPERTAKENAQRLRRIYYSALTHSNGGLFDRSIETVPTTGPELVRVPAVSQDTLDAVVRAPLLSVGPAPSAPLVDVSHVLVLLDLALSDRGWAGVAALNSNPPGPLALAGLLSWAGDLGSCWVTFNGEREKAAAAVTEAGGTWSEALSDLSMVESNLAAGLAQRGSVEDIFGDMDAVILTDDLGSFHGSVSATPIADLLAAYYGPRPSGFGSSTRHVDNRFSLFVQRARPEIPHTVAGGKVTLAATAEADIRKIIKAAGYALLLGSRTSHSVAYSSYLTGRSKVVEALDSPWSGVLLDVLAKLFTEFLTAGLAGDAWTSGPLTAWRRFPNAVRTVDHWPAQQPSRALYPGPGPDLAPFDEAGPTRLGRLSSVLAISATYSDPWVAKAGPTGTVATMSRWNHVDLRDPRGPGFTTLTAGPVSVLRLAGHWPLWDVTKRPASAPGRAHGDILHLLDGEGEAAAVSHFEIVDVDPAARTVSVAGTPSPTAGRWRIHRRPTIVVIDSYGAREGCSGLGATVHSYDAALDLTTVQLTGTPDLARVNRALDTLHLGSDSARAWGAYRIVAVDNAAHRVRVVGRPRIAASAWRIGAGVGGSRLGRATYPLDPHPNGTDNYDALLCLVWDDTVQSSYPFTSYSSTQQTDPEWLSSVRGNMIYHYTAVRSTNSYRNYSLQVSSTPDSDTVAQARYYFDRVSGDGTDSTDRGEGVRADPHKDEIRLHYGNPTGTRSGSAGCLVSPVYDRFRADLIAIHQRERVMLGRDADPALAQIATADTHAAAMALYNSTDPDWVGVLNGRLWLARPEERPLTT